MCPLPGAGSQILSKWISRIGAQIAPDVLKNPEIPDSVMFLLLAFLFPSSFFLRYAVATSRRGVNYRRESLRARAS